MGKLGFGWSFHPLIPLFIGVLVISAVYLTRDRIRVLEDETSSRNSLSHCNFFSGKWVYDNQSYPLYKEQECSFMLGDFACNKYGRMDLNYQHWRWQPQGCDLPRFDATALLEKLRGKRLVFVGDSLMRNQWMSMVCLVQSSILPGLKSTSRHLNGSLYTFKTTEYNATIDFYWAPFLVESNMDDPYHHHAQSQRIVQIQAIEKHAKYWTDADILVFDSYIWWLIDNMKTLWNSSGNSTLFSEDLNMLSRYEMGLKTWADWLETHVNRTKTKLYFVSMSPSHTRGEEWGKEANQNCYNETEPIFQEWYWGSLSDTRMMQVVVTTIERLKVKGVTVQFLNITQLSEYRKDAHPSIHSKQWVPLTAEQLSNPPSYSDCSHWCLPGVPDAWNEILYAYVFHDS